LSNHFNIFSVLWEATSNFIFRPFPLQLLQHCQLINLNDVSVVVLADDGADGVDVGQKTGGFVGGGSQENLELVVHHKFEGTGGAGCIHLAKGFIKEGQTDGVGRAGLVEAVGLGEGGSHSYIEGRGGFAARFFGVNLAEEGSMALLVTLEMLRRRSERLRGVTR
jgi:hypothetical protein